MLEFKSMDGNTYAWDEDVGLFIPFFPAMRAVVREISDINTLSREDVIERLRGDFNEEDIEFCYDWIQKWKRIMPLNRDMLTGFSYGDLSASKIKSYLLQFGLRQLTLGITEDCNFRCKYCVYSGNYDHSRSHSKSCMNFTVAKKAIDYYFSLLEMGRRYNPKRKTAVSFFGGEPLINFNLIKKCVEYIESTYDIFETSYNLTTNGSLLDEDKAEWLMQNNISMLISIDGPKEEHDRNRVYRNGKGTFKDVMKNVTKLINAKYDKFSAISTFEWKSDLFKRDEFFSKSEVPLANVSAVSEVPGCKYYDQFSYDDRLTMIEQMKKARTYYLETFIDRRKQKRKHSVFDMMFGIGSLQAIHGGHSVFMPPSIIPYTGACIPGEKIFVDVEGNFHLCERVNGTYPIGNVNEGLDLEEISKLIADYLHHMDKCASCKLRRSCSKCYANFITDGGFLYSSEVCKGVESQIDNLAMAFTIGERDPTYIDNTNNYLSLIKQSME